MRIDFRKTLDNAGRNITKASIKRETTRTWQTIQNYYTGMVQVPKNVEKVLIKMFEENGDQVFYIEE